jgi:glycosyltransferase involved in cell wall biosynthesis
MSSTTPMGQQGYEREVQRAIVRLADDHWRFSRVELGSLRSSSGTRRFPARLYGRAPLALAQLLGAASYRTRGLVHRFDLRVPPAPRLEIVTIHDLPPLRFSDEGSLPASAAAGARRARLVICPSAFAAYEVQELLGVNPERIRVIFNGIGSAFRSPQPIDDSALVEWGIRDPFVVHAAGATQRKNLGALAAAWRLVTSQVPAATLVLCGPPDPRRDALFATQPSVVRVGRLEPARLAALMAGAAAVVVPSTYEGFGLPAVEGMACGVPVVAARAGALPEICADAAILVDPTGDAIAGGLITALTDPDRAQQLRAAGMRRAASFTWEASAAEHLAAYRRVLDNEES